MAGPINTTNEGIQFPESGNTSWYDELQALCEQILDKRLRSFELKRADTGAHEAVPNGAITAFADGGGGQVVVTSAVHGLSENDAVGIYGTVNYNGNFTATNVTTNTFEITDTWVSDDAAGNFYSLIEYESSNQQGSRFGMVYTRMFVNILTSTGVQTLVSASSWTKIVTFGGDQKNSSDTDSFSALGTATNSTTYHLISVSGSTGDVTFTPGAAYDDVDDSYTIWIDYTRT